MRVYELLHYSSQQTLRTSGAGHPQGGADTHGGPSEGPGGLPETQLPVPGESALGWVAAQCCGRRITWMAVLVPRLHTASSLRIPRIRRWLGFTATQRRPSRSGWSFGSKAQGGGQDPGRGLAGWRSDLLSSSPRDPSVKRTLCRCCSSLLIPGITCTQRQRRECCPRDICAVGTLEDRAGLSSST